SDRSPLKMALTPSDNQLGNKTHPIFLLPNFAASDCLTSSFSNFWSSSFSIIINSSDSLSFFFLVNDDDDNNGDLADFFRIDDTAISFMISRNFSFLKIKIC